MARKGVEMDVDQLIQWVHFGHRPGCNVLWDEQPIDILLFHHVWRLIDG
jgi:hypothetical protein